jgi:predicted nuclease of predicted toxin-antitoxin system
MRFLIDAQLPPALARWLGAASDSEIWDYGLQYQAVIVTKDDDFAQRKGLENGGPAIIWVRLPNARTRDLLAWFEIALPVALEALKRGETLVELI